MQNTTSSPPPDEASRTGEPVAAVRSRRGGKALVLAVQAALSVWLAWSVLRGLDWAALGGMAARQGLGFFLGAGAMSVLVTALYAVRWGEVLRAMGHPRPLPALARQVFVGVFFNNFAPSMLGQDASKTYYLGRDTGYVNAGVSVLVDKILGLGCMTALGVALFPLLGLAGPLRTGALTAALGLLGVCCVALAAFRLPLERLMPASLSRWPLGARLLDLACRGRSCAGSAVTLRVLAASLGLMALSMALQAGVYAWFLVSATGVSPSIPALAGALCLMTAVTNMPVSVNGIGVREQAHALLLAGLGVPLEAAVGLSLLQYLFMLGQSLLGWGLWLARPRRPETPGPEPAQ